MTVYLASPAGAVDGVIEINQASVDAGGGFPFTISISGSYRLTSNLVETALGVPSLISITAGDVTLDLNGFSIVGYYPSSQEGIVSTAENVAVINGTVRDVAGGIWLSGRGARVDRIRVPAGGIHESIELGGWCRLTNSSVLGSGSGVIAGSSCHVSANNISVERNGIPLSGGIEIGINVCGGNTNCP